VTGNRVPPEDPGLRLEELLAQEDLRSPDSDDPAGAVDSVTETSPGRDPETATVGDATGDLRPPDARDLPDAPLFGLLRIIEQEVAIERIDRVWIFPPRRLDAGETAVVVVSAYPEVGTDRRTVFAAHYTAPADDSDPRLTLDEFGTAPADRVGRVVEEVVDRLKDEPAAPPRTTRIEGDEARWHDLVHGLAEQRLDEAVARHGRFRYPRALVDEPRSSAPEGRTGSR